MSKLKTADFYYGAVLSTLLNHKICPILIEGGTDRKVYDFTTDQKDFRLFLKYRSKPNLTQSPDYSSWQFVFSDDDIRELKQFAASGKMLSVGLVCGQDALNKSEYAVIHQEELLQLFSEGKTSLTISIMKGEKAFRISTGGGRDNAIQIKTNRLY